MTTDVGQDQKKMKRTSDVCLCGLVNKVVSRSGRCPPPSSGTPALVFLLPSKPDDVGRLVIQTSASLACVCVLVECAHVDPDPPSLLCLQTHMHEHARAFFFQLTADPFRRTRPRSSFMNSCSVMKVHRPAHADLSSVQKFHWSLTLDFLSCHILVLLPPKLRAKFKCRLMFLREECYQKCT